MKKNAYEKPGMVMVNLQHQQLICESYGVNGRLQGDNVNSAWTKESSGDWDDEDW